MTRKFLSDGHELIAAVAFVFCMIFVFCIISVDKASSQDLGKQINKLLGKQPVATSYQPAEKPANFIFLVDVSGSMVSHSTMVKGAGDSQTTLFEALREALRQIVANDDLVGKGSKVSIITFGTKVEEKTNWPVAIKSENDRKSLTERILSQEELKADRQGDTYMAGGLDTAYRRAIQFTKESDPCTTTFIIMLTDGWDEPPKGAQLDVRTLSKKFQEKSKELADKLATSTWQVRVVGLRRLPGTKVGTTTAAQVADLLGGNFVDVTRQAEGTVAQQIFAAVRETIEELRGQVRFPTPGEGGILNFGTITDTPRSDCAITVFSTSCDTEKITGIVDETSGASGESISALKDTIAKVSRNLKGISQEAIAGSKPCPEGALTFRVKGAEVILTPERLQKGESGNHHVPLTVEATVNSSCPPGTYVGFVKLLATARVKEPIPFLISVPPRLVVSPSRLECKVRKPGFFKTSDTSVELDFNISASVLSDYNSDFEILIKPVAPRAKQNSDCIDIARVNGGKPKAVTVSTKDKAGKPVRLTIDIPSSQGGGTYSGILSIAATNAGDLIAPLALPFTVKVLPGAWEEVRPLAIPIFVLLFLTLAAGTWLAVRRSNR